jgi:hypothetical protein
MVMKVAAVMVVVARVVFLKVRKILAKLDEMTEKINNPTQMPTNVVKPLNFTVLQDFEEYDFQLVNHAAENADWYVKTGMNN